MPRCCETVSNFHNEMSGWQEQCVDAEMTCDGRPVSFRDSTAPHLSALYSCRLNGCKLAWESGVYALLHQDNRWRIGRYWLVPSVQRAVGQSCVKIVLHSKNCVLRQQGPNCIIIACRKIAIFWLDYLFDRFSVLHCTYRYAFWISSLPLICIILYIIIVIICFHLTC